MKKRYTKRQILESIKYWKKQLKAGNYKKVNESTQHQFEVIATAWTRDGITIDETVDAKDYYELVSFVREAFARELNIDDDDADNIRFTFDKVVDENGEDVTDVANEYVV